MTAQNCGYNENTVHVINYVDPVEPPLASMCVNLDNSISMMCYYRECFFTIESASCKSKFMLQINSSFGSGGMSLALNEVHFAAFIQYLKSQQVASKRKAASTIGIQPCMKEWVLGKNLIIDENGVLISAQQPTYIWLDRDMLGDAGYNVPAQDIVPTIKTPLSTTHLKELLQLMNVLKHNYISGLLVLAGGIMSLHYSSITMTFAGCPVVVAHGPAETGKTTSIKATLAMLGLL